MTKDKHPKLLLLWYQRHHRDLPWRTTKDPYLIWVCEIIFQQTRIEQGLPYYHRFLQRFPNILSLAKASPTEVLSVWEGLGYYRRALNMHKCANIVVNQLNGIFPSDYLSLLKLPGIGDYTASAISSICSGEKRTTIDGNVKRFISRLYNIHEVPDMTPTLSEIRINAMAFTKYADPGIMNQAMMEFGALQCTPANPLCTECPFKDCLAMKENTVDLLPVKSGKRGTRSRYFQYYFFLWKEDGLFYTLMTQRGDHDIWPHLYEFPLNETPHPTHHLAYDKNFTELFMESPGSITFHTHKDPEVQQLTHQRIYARFLLCRLPGKPLWYNEGLLKVNLDEMVQLPKPRLINRYLDSSLPFLS